MATKKELQLTLPEIVAEKQRLANESAALEERLQTVKDSARTELDAKLSEFNETFGTTYALTEPKAPRSTKPRKCKLCKETGHTSKNCPTKAPAPVQSIA